MKFSNFFVVATYKVIFSVLNLRCFTVNFNGMPALVSSVIEA